MLSLLRSGVLFLFSTCMGFAALGQEDSLGLPADDLRVLADMVEDGTEPMDMYEPLNEALGGDSMRMCAGYACTGWVEDHHPDGAIMHRGYYKDGRLLVYRNYRTDGTLEREFKVVGNTRCLMRTYHDNGIVRTEIDYVKGEPRTYTDHYPNGQVRYREEKHASLPIYLVMDLFAADGKPVSTLHVIDKNKGLMEQKEYWPNGAVRCAGRSQFNPVRHDSQRVGEWTYFDEAGRPRKLERYIDGKVHEVADL